jgi:hypothetical protein
MITDLQAETGILYEKFGAMRKDIWQFPPYRLLADLGLAK